ncbi:hypothetical protein C7M84_013689 [Penaeus vannamei]|uniref:Uncharacterized protein n=1 Tax=Penaeus vannamei TaxID=6689 RepID=A0A3R7Q4A2_PENVA|nr:hypothetical protein C7M84_013689 [Penaeus vannamei]
MYVYVPTRFIWCREYSRKLCVQVLFGVIAAALAAPVPDEKVVAVHGAVAPAVLTYGAHALTHAVAPGAVSYAAPALTHAVAPAAVSYAAPAVHHAVAPAAVSYAAPAVHHAVAPAAVSYAAPAVHHAVAPAVAYAAPTPVALPPAEVKVPVTRTHVEVPVHQKVHYGTQNYVAGATTTIHKPSLAAPAIAPPSTLLAKVTHNAPELTIQRQEVPVEKHTPNFVDTPYHAGTIVKYTEPEVREVKVLFGVIAAALAAPVPDEKVVAVHGAVAPAALTYGAHALTHAVAPGAVSYAAPAVHHAVAPAAVSYAAPAVHHAVAPAAVSYAAPLCTTAPAAVSYAAPAVHHAVAPAVAYAAPPSGTAPGRGQGPRHPHARRGPRPPEGPLWHPELRRWRHNHHPQAIPGCACHCPALHTPG